MKQLLGGILALTLITGVTSCSEDFNVAAPYKEITVCYGLLNMSDTAHYIRIQKAFLDESKNAMEMAKDGDSSYYTALDVRIREISSSNQVVNETVLPRVDLTAEGYPKEPGVFFQTPHYAYKYKHNLKANHTYRLVIHHTTSGKTDSAETVVIYDNPDDHSDGFSVYGFNNTDFEIEFTNAGRPNGKFTLNGTSAPHGRLYEGVIRFHWIDKDVNTNTITRHAADWNFANVTTTAAMFTLSTAHSGFFPFLLNTMKPAPAHIERYIDSSDIFVWTATEDVYTYQRYQMASGGLTGDQIRPNYTNFEGSDVLGLFASRGVKYKLQVPFSAKTLDSLRLHPDVLPLKIRGVSEQ